MSFVWDVVVTRYWGTGDGSVRRVGDRPPDVRMPWADVIDRAVCLAGPGATVTVRVVVTWFLSGCAYSGVSLTGFRPGGGFSCCGR